MSRDVVDDSGGGVGEIRCYVNLHVLSEKVCWLSLYMFRRIYLAAVSIYTLCMHRVSFCSTTTAAIAVTVAAPTLQTATIVIAHTDEE